MPTAWVVESLEYCGAVRAALNGSSAWDVVWCGANGSLCSGADPRVAAVIGMADALDLGTLGGLRLVQGTSSYYPALSEVPTRAAVSSYSPYYEPGYRERAAHVIAEYMIAAAMQRLCAHGARTLDSRSNRPMTR